MGNGLVVRSIRSMVERPARDAGVLQNGDRSTRTLVVFAAALVAVLVIIPSQAFAVVPTGPLRTGFPRLANWSPDVDKQPLADLARFDYLALYDGQARAIPALRQLNPNIVLLTYTSAVEVGVNHPLLNEVPNAWILTQVGSTLSSAVSSDTTTLPVGNPDRFRQGQLVIVGEEELARVVSVGTSSIQVVRGVRADRAPAAPHLAGTRIAAVVQRFDTNIEMNVSTYCPKVTVDSSVGPENWAQFAARRTAERCALADWDGVVIDRVEDGESFLVAKGRTVSIDPANSNAYVTDKYAAFDKAWIAGVGEYVAAVRSHLGSGKLMVGNNAAARYGLVNGSNLENFPRFNPASLPAMPYRESYEQYWNWGRSFYSGWSTNGLQPNFSTIMTYDYEPEPLPGETPPGVGTPDYRKMRFGLSTALMGDGFFTYQLRVWGQRVGTFWFDEYDNAGTQRGYLGLPISDERLALAPVSTADKLLGHGSFNSAASFNAWQLFVSTGYSASKSLSSGAAQVDVKASQSKIDGVGFFTGYFPVKSGRPYTVRFRAKADRQTTLRLRIATRNAPWQDFMGFYEVPLTTSWRTYEYSSYSRGDDADARVVFDLSGSQKSVWFDDVTVQEGSRLNIMRRDFEGGAAFVNSTDATVTIPLGVPFRKISGTQVRAINNGALVSQVALPPRDGIILLAESATPRVNTFLAASSSATVFRGRPVRIGATLRNTSEAGTVIAGQTVSLQKSSNGKDGWRTIATGRTSSAGFASWRVAPRASTYYRVCYAGKSKCWFATSSNAVFVHRARVSWRTR